MRRRHLLVPGVTLAALAGLYAALQPASMAGAVAAHDICSAGDDIAAVAAAAAQPSGRAIRVAVDASSPVATTVREGEVVALDLDAPRAGEVTVHGLSEATYAVSAGPHAQIRFPAARPGLYAVHFHGPSGEHVPLALVEIQPR